MRIATAALLLLVTACVSAEEPSEPNVPGGGKGDGTKVEILSLAARQAFCAVAQPNTAADPYAYQVCLNFTEEAAVIEVWLPGCDSMRDLRKAMSCYATKGSTAECSALYDAWFLKTERATACELPDHSIGLGDPYPPYGDGSWFCQSGAGADAGNCTRGCWEDSDCDGLGPGGLNRFGYRNVCVDQVCLTTCDTTTDCADRFDEARVGNPITCDAITSMSGLETRACQMHERRR